MSKEISTMSARLDSRSVLSFFIEHGYDTIIDHLKTRKGGHSPRFYIQLVNALLANPEFAHLSVIARQEPRWLWLKDFATRCTSFATLGENDAKQVWYMQRRTQEKQHYSTHYVIGLRVGWELVDKPEGAKEWEIAAYKGWYEQGFANAWNDVPMIAAGEWPPQPETMIDPIFLEKFQKELHREESGRRS